MTYSIYITPVQKEAKQWLINKTAQKISKLQCSVIIPKISFCQKKVPSQFRNSHVTSNAKKVRRHDGRTGRTIFLIQQRNKRVKTWNFWKVQKKIQGNWRSTQTHGEIKGKNGQAAKNSRQMPNWWTRKHVISTSSRYLEKNLNRNKEGSSISSLNQPLPCSSCASVSLEQSINTYSASSKERKNQCIFISHKLEFLQHIYAKKRCPEKIE